MKRAWAQNGSKWNRIVAVCDADTACQDSFKCQLWAPNYQSWGTGCEHRQLPHSHNLCLWAMAGRCTLLQNVKLAELLSAAKTFNLENTVPSYVLLFEDACGWIEPVGLSAQTMHTFGSIPSWMVHLATHGSNQSRKGCHPHHMVYVCMTMYIYIYIIYIYYIYI